MRLSSRSRRVVLALAIGVTGVGAVALAGGDRATEHADPADLGRTAVPGPSVAQVGPPPDESERYPGGIPREIDGHPVYVGAEAQAVLASAADARSFLVGGWYDSQPLAVFCSGGFGPVDPNPLGKRGCPTYAVEGAPGWLHFPEGLAMPQGDGPIVLDVHTRDPDAATCLPENRQRCLEVVVVDAVSWFGDESTAAQPIGPGRARRDLLKVAPSEVRVQPDGANAHVAEDLFTVPLACPDPWPPLLFRVHGDPRYGLVAVFRDVAAREAFETLVAPEDAITCITTSFERPGGPRWTPAENVLILSFGDEGFAAAIGAAVRGVPDDQLMAVPMTDPAMDRSAETLVDYLVARAAGLVSHAWGVRLSDPEDETLPGEDKLWETHQAWIRDMHRRSMEHALTGDVEQIDGPGDANTVGPEAVDQLVAHGATEAWRFRVTYPAATEDELRVEEFVVFRIADSTSHDWMLIRVVGAPYPRRP